MIGNFELAYEEFSALAGGMGSPSTLRTLRSAQLSKHMLLIRSVGARQPDPRWDDALAVFAQASESPQAERILVDPWTGAWAARCLRQFERIGALPPTDSLHFNALAAALAIGTGLDADLTVPVRDTAGVYLPTLGFLRVTSGRPTHRLRIRGGTVASIPEDLETDTPGWLGHRRLDAGGIDAAARVILDDLSPYRDTFRLTPADRLGGSELAAWRLRWAQAWSLLQGQAPARVPELLSCLNTAVPLSVAGTRAGRSATARDAFGAIGLSLPPDSINLAVTMIHECQHAKLGALLDLMDLYKDSSDTYFAPWRRDPRPVAGLIQGAYAFLGIADTWWRLSADPAVEQFALRQFAYVREQVSVATDSLEAAPSLTGDGRAFVAGMRESLDRLLAVDLPRCIVLDAKAELSRVHEAWRMANVHAPK